MFNLSESIQTLIKDPNFMLKSARSQVQSHDTRSNKTTDNLKSNHSLSFVSSVSCDPQRSNWLTPGEFRRTCRIHWCNTSSSAMAVFSSDSSSSLSKNRE
jgi:hypothetical protein